MAIPISSKSKVSSVVARPSTSDVGMQWLHEMPSNTQLPQADEMAEMLALAAPMEERLTTHPVEDMEIITISDTSPEKTPAPWSGYSQPLTSEEYDSDYERQRIQKYGDPGKSLLAGVLHTSDEETVEVVNDRKRKRDCETMDGRRKRFTKRRRMAKPEKSRGELEAELRSGELITQCMAERIEMLEESLKREVDRNRRKDIIIQSYIDSMSRSNVKLTGYLAQV